MFPSPIHLCVTYDRKIVGPAACNSYYCYRLGTRIQFLMLTLWFSFRAGLFGVRQPKVACNLEWSLGPQSINGMVHSLETPISQVPEWIGGWNSARIPNSTRRIRFWANQDHSYSWIAPNRPSKPKNELPDRFSADIDPILSLIVTEFGGEPDTKVQKFSRFTGSVESDHNSTSDPQALTGEIVVVFSPKSTLNPMGNIPELSNFTHDSPFWPIRT